MPLISVERIWDPAKRTPALLASAATIAAIALVDWWTFPYVSLGLLYLFPIMLAAGFLSRKGVIALALACAVLSEAFSSLDPQGRPARFLFEALALVGCGLFVSEMNRTRRRANEIERRLRTLVETSPAAILTVNEHALIEVTNQAALELFRVPQGALAGRPISGFVPGLQPAVRPPGTQFRASMRCQALRGDGESFCSEVWFSTFHEGKAPKLAAIIADVTADEPPPAIPVALEPIARPVFNSRQLAVLRMVFEGLPNREIAARLELTVSAVKNTLQQIFLKAGVTNRSQMVRVALERYRDLL
jgi:DNA-binding CsgD family transcriptional regulator/PAS domain-containing protein